MLVNLCCCWSSGRSINLMPSHTHKTRTINRHRSQIWPKKDPQSTSTPWLLLLVLLLLPSVARLAPHEMLINTCALFCQPQPPSLLCSACLRASRRLCRGFLVGPTLTLSLLFLSRSRSHQHHHTVGRRGDFSDHPSAALHLLLLALLMLRTFVDGRPF